MKHLLINLVLALISTTLIQAQGFNMGCEFPNPLRYKASFLTNPVDARSGAMGYTGVANSKGATAQFFNSAQLAFTENSFGVTLSARSPKTEGFEDIEGFEGIERIDDVYLYGAAYYRINENQTIGFSYHRNQIGKKFYPFNELPFLMPSKELAISGSYNRKITDHLALGVTAKYIYANLYRLSFWNIDNSKVAHTYAGTFSLNYRKPINFRKGEGLITFGSTIRNLGKMYYPTDSASVFLPSQLGIGVSFDYQINPNHSFSFAFDINRYLIPTPTYYTSIDVPAFNDKPILEGALNSLWEAPCGFSEKVQENMYAIGIEYQFKNLSLRAGHYNSHQLKDNIKAITAGIGFDFSHFSANVSYAKNYTKQHYYFLNKKAIPVYQATITFDLLTKELGKDG